MKGLILFLMLLTIAGTAAIQPWWASVIIPIAFALGWVGGMKWCIDWGQDKKEVAATVRWAEKRKGESIPRP